MTSDRHRLIINASKLFATFFLMTIAQATDRLAATATIPNNTVSKSSSVLLADGRNNRPKAKQQSPSIQAIPIPTQPRFTQVPAPPAPTITPAVEPELTIDVTGERKLYLPKSTPTYTIDSQQIERQGSKNVADTLNNLPGFAINNAGYGADIHTGTYYRGASINQFIILLNGRPIGNNINTYHGATDLNSIPVDAITSGRLRQRSDRAF